MFSYLRSNPEANPDNKYSYITSSMRDNVRQNRSSILTGIDHSNVGMLAEIHMREFACMMHTLKQVNWVASKYHEHAFDNTDAYIEGQTPLQTHELNAEQRHATQLLLGVGNSYSEINVALRILDSGSFQAAMECSPEMCAKLSQQFSANASMAEDAFDRLNHMTKHVWSLVNLLAFSNLFRFVDHVVLPNPEDSIFIPYIPMKPFVEPILCHACGARTDEKYHKMTHPKSTFNLCPTCFHRPTMQETFDKLCEQEREIQQQQQQQQQNQSDPESESESESDKSYNDDEANATYWLKTVADWTATDRRNKSEMNAQNAQNQQHFNEIGEMLADGKITTEQACSLFKELIDDVNAENA